MATKSITITSEAYEKLAFFKSPNESFSDVVNKLTKRSSLGDLIGLLSNEEADALEEFIVTKRKKMRKRINRISKQLSAK